MTQEMDALERTVQLGQQRVDGSADTGAALRDQLRDGGAMTLRNRLERRFEGVVAPLREPRALEQ
jgi:hypothetical protein